MSVLPPASDGKAFPMLLFLSSMIVFVIAVGTAAQSRNVSLDELMSSDQGRADADVRKGCPNWQGKVVADGEKYIPDGNDMCTQCTCDRGFPIMCHSVACSPPLQCANPRQVKGVCCEYTCLDDGVVKGGNSTDVSSNGDRDDGENITNLSLRLIASTVTSFLVLALLLFMVHRLRQRRLLLAMRRFEARAQQGHTEDTDSDPYIPDAFLSLECPPYTDPPPPYSPPKPPQILPGEQPPPYDEINDNIRESNADENRNQIRLGGSGADSIGATDQDGGVTQRGQATSRNQGEVEGRQPVHGTELRSQRSTGGTQRAANTLPAYASTDVVEGFGVVISPGSEMVCYSSSGWNNWLAAAPDLSAAAAVAQAVPKHQWRGCGATSYSPAAVAVCGPRVHALPSTTAFQRFSNIFRRDSWRTRSRHQPGRPASEYSTTSQYATIPRNEQSPCSGHSRSRPQTRAKNVSRSFCSGFPDTLCLSYGTEHPSYTQPDHCAYTHPDHRSYAHPNHHSYTLGAVSPSTSTSSSTSCSENYDPPAAATSSTTPGTSSTRNSSCSPPVASTSSTVVDSYLTSPAHRQLFHDDLRRHLPPLQLADPPQDSSCFLVPKSPVDPSCTNQTGRNQDQVAQHIIRQSSIVEGLYTRDPALPHASHIPSLHPIMSAATTSSTPAGHHLRSGQPTLSSFMRPQPSSSNIACGESFLRTDHHQLVPTTAECSQIQANPSLQTCSNYFTTVPPWNCALPPEMCHAPATASHYLTSVPEFSSPCQAKFPGLCEQPTLSMLLVATSVPASTTCPPAAPTVEAPIPQPCNSPQISGSGVLRRSLSGTSQASMFSVCSETGEKKLKDSDNVGAVPTGSFSYNSNGNFAHVGSHGLSKARPLHDLEAQDITGARSSATEPTFDDKCHLHNDIQPLYQSQQQQDVINNSSACAGVAEAMTSQLVFKSVALSSFPAARPHDDNDDNESCGTSSIYNFNTLAGADKSLAAKDVPSLCSDAMSQSVNIPPVSTFITAQPGKMPSPDAQKCDLPTIQDQGISTRSGKPHLVLQKLKKKRVKDRSVYNQQLGNAARHGPSSPKHVHLKVCDWTKESSTGQRLDTEKDAAVHPLKCGDRRHRSHSGISKLHVRMCEPLGGVSRLMSRSASDAQAMYGNADVYRSVGGEGIDPALTYQHQTFSLWSQQGHPGDCDFNAEVTLNDLNQPPGYLKCQPDHSSPGHTANGRDGHASGKADVRRKGTHKRQLSAGHIPSPSRCKSRPKSLVSQDVPANEKRSDPVLPRPSLTSNDFIQSVKGARSGFGHDLNFDDQSGIADLHLVETDTNRRVSLCQDPHTGPGPTRKLSRGDANSDSSSAIVKGGTAAYGSKSGLSNDLSFTSRPTLGAGHNKKRQSFPTGSSGASFLGTQDRANMGGAIRSRHADGEGHMHVGQVRGERRADRASFVDDYVEATSYV